MNQDNDLSSIDRAYCMYYLIARVDMFSWSVGRHALWWYIRLNRRAVIFSPLNTSHDYTVVYRVLTSNKFSQLNTTEVTVCHTCWYWYPVKCSFDIIWNKDALKCKVVFIILKNTIHMAIKKQLDQAGSHTQSTIPRLLCALCLR